MTSNSRPERIWLLHGLGDCGEDVWCAEPNPVGLPEDEVEATEYVRADLAAAVVELVRAVEALEAAREAEREDIVEALVDLQRKRDRVKEVCPELVRMAENPKDVRRPG